MRSYGVRAGVYYLRSILHNWSDKYALRILRALVPALEPGARVLVHELMLPEPNTVSITEERRMRFVCFVSLRFAF